MDDVMVTDDLLLQAAVDMRKLPAGSILAYSGGIMRVPGGGPIVIDLANLDVSGGVAILSDHDSTRRGVEAVEKKRVANIASICGTKYPEIQARAIEDGWDETRCELEVLRASRPKPPTVWRSEPAVATGSVLEAALLSHMGMMTLGEKTLGSMAMEQADRLGATSMIDLCRAALQADGRDVPIGRMELVKAAMSTMSLPTSLGNVANKVLLDSYNETPASWRAFCAIRSTSDFKTNTAIRPSFTGQLEQVAPGGEIKHGGISEAVTTFSVDTFGKMLSIDRRDIINDDLSVFQDAACERRLKTVALWRSPTVGDNTNSRPFANQRRPGYEDVGVANTFDIVLGVCSEYGFKVIHVVRIDITSFGLIFRYRWKAFPY